MMTERFDLVSVNDTQSSSLAGAYFKKLGWEDICFIGQYDRSNPKSLEEVSQKRLMGLEKGLGRPIRPECQLRCYAHMDIYGAEAVSRWLNITPRPPAIFAASDDLAFGFINGAYAHGLTPGRDYQIIGFDGQQQSKDTGVGILTTVVVPMEDMGILGAQLLQARLKNPNRPTHQAFLGCHLLEGNTVVPKASIP
jgi:DNA-binding LacI/PurR family transcriptional regulator